MKKLIKTAVAGILCVAALSGCGTKTPSTTSQPPANQTAKEVKVAGIYAGAITDGSWNQTQYNGLKNIETKGAKIAYMENVNETNVAEAARTYATEGYNLVYLATNAYQDYCTPIAKDFKDVKFVQINGSVSDGNFISVRIADEEQGFLQGAIAALLSQTGKVGFIGGQEINPIKLGSSGFQQGVDYVNATYGTKVEAVRINTGSMTDTQKAKEQAISMIEGGCDVVAPMANQASLGVMEAAEEKGAMAIGSGAGQESSAKTATRIVVIKDVSKAYDATYADFSAGKLEANGVATFGVNKGVVSLTDWFGTVDQGVKDKVTEIMNKMASGEIKITTN